MKKPRLWSICCGIALCLSSGSWAQELLTLREAVEITLLENYDLRLARQDLKSDSLLVSPGQAGMLPRVVAQASSANSLQHIAQTRSDGNVIELDNARSNSLSYGVGLEWTLFDGLGMFARYDRLKELQKLGEVELQKTIVERVGQVMEGYYDLVQQQQQLRALDSTLLISQQRVELADNRFQIGKASKLEVLNAQVDLNTDKTMAAQQKERYEHAKMALNTLMARDPQIQFRVVEKIEIDKELAIGTLKDRALAQNPQLQAQLVQNRIAQLELKEVKSRRLPTVAATTGYNFSDSKSSLGFTTQNNARGWNYGFSASVPLFDGFNNRRNMQRAQIAVENSEIVLAQQKLEIERQLYQAYETYLTHLDLIGLEKDNEAIAQENLEITMAKYDIGTIPTIEFRTAQLNAINAKLRLSNALYQAKLSEIQLQELAGSLPLE